MARDISAGDKLVGPWGKCKVLAVVNSYAMLCRYPLCRNHPSVRSVQSLKGPHWKQFEGGAER